MKVKIHGQETGEASYWLWCPGCGDAHRITNLWSFNGDTERPTFEPSILSEGGPPGTPRCHSFLREGVWQFLDDSTHELAGKSVPMVDLPDWLARSSG